MAVNFTMFRQFVDPGHIDRYNSCFAMLMRCQINVEEVPVHRRTHYPTCTHVHRYHFPNQLLAHMAKAQHEDCAAATARCIIDTYDIWGPNLANLKIALRNLFIAQVTHPTPLSKPELDNVFAGPLFTSSHRIHRIIAIIIQRSLRRLLHRGPQESAFSCLPPRRLRQARTGPAQTKTA